MRKRESIAARRINRVLLRRLDVSCDGAQTKKKETRHDQLQERSGRACRGTRRKRAGIAKLCTGRRRQNQPETGASPSRVQRFGRALPGISLGQHGKVSVRGLYGRTWRAGIIGGVMVILKKRVTAIA